MSEPYALYYWPVLPGRGELIRLILEDAQVPYRDVGREEGMDAIFGVRHGAVEDHPTFAPPVLRHGDLVLSQTAVIARYLAARHGLAPQTEHGRLLADQHFLGWSDLMHEVHDTHHPIASSLRYEDQREAATLRAHRFREDRLGPWLRHFERVVQRGRGVHVPAEMSYVDLAARFVLRGIEHAFPGAFERLKPELPGLLALVDRVERRPALRSYLNSDRAMRFNHDGIFRHYPELDG